MPCLIPYFICCAQALSEGCLHSNSKNPGGPTLVTAESGLDFKDHLAQSLLFRDKIMWCDRGACGAD